MIWFYSGTPGSGKSLHMAEDIYIKLFKAKQNVIANFEINEEIYNSFDDKGEFFYVPSEELTPDFLYNYAKTNKNHILGKESQTLVCIDECCDLFDPRSWNIKTRPAWTKFFRVHRHWGFNCLLTSQADVFVDKQIRLLFEYECKHRLLNNFKIFRNLPFKVFIYVTYWYSIKTKIDSRKFLLRKKYANMYDTFKNFN